MKKTPEGSTGELVVTVKTGIQLIHIFRGIDVDGGSYYRMYQYTVKKDGTIEVKPRRANVAGDYTDILYDIQALLEDDVTLEIPVFDAMLQISDRIHAMEAQDKAVKRFMNNTTIGNITTLKKSALTAELESKGLNESEIEAIKDLLESYWNELKKEGANNE